MSYILFHRVSDNFNDILSDKVIKKKIRLKMSFKNYLILGLEDETSVSYMILKYGDDIVNMSDVLPDRSPKPNIDYTPKKK